MSYVVSSESVSVGHPDKVCDQISDAILDAYLRKDPFAKVAVECLITKQNLVIAGEIHSKASVDIVQVAKNVLKEVGYSSVEVDFNPETATYQNLVHTQSNEINHSVSDGGAGDQGHVFGFATIETPQLLPLSYVMATNLMKAHAKYRKKTSEPILLPDAKAQVSIAYKDNKPVSIKTIVLSSQHKVEVSQDEVKKSIINELILPEVQKYPELNFSRDALLINTSGSFTKGGPSADTGLTGRKLIVDTYGGFAPHGGGAFSGKDASKVDRSAAYLARYIAKQVVWSGIAEKCLVEIAYAIGVKQPVAFRIDTLKTGTYDDKKVANALRFLVNMDQQSVNQLFRLSKPIFKETAKHGHFTNPDFPWEKKDKVLINQLLKSLVATETVNPEVNTTKRKISTHALPKEKSEFKDVDLKKHKTCFPEGGYGKFPYIIIRAKLAGPALMMQIPIHLLAEGEGYNPYIHKGTLLKDVKEKVLQLDDSSKFEALLPELKELTKKAVNKLEANNKGVRWACLVLSEEIGHYLEQNEWREKTTIPSGGTLINQKMDVMTIAEPHYIHESLR